LPEQEPSRARHRRPGGRSAVPGRRSGPPPWI